MGTKQSKLKPTDVKELADQTDFTESEIQLWYKSFSKDCPSGQLAVEEFENIYKNFFPDGDASSFAQHAFRTFDKNKDGSIDFREFLTALSVMSRGSFSSKLDWAFSLYDQDKDGFVTKAEMLEIVKAIYSMVGEKFMSEAVTNNVSAEKRVENLFSKIDKNGDELITAEEFKKAAAEDPGLVMILNMGGKAQQ